MAKEAATAAVVTLDLHQARLHFGAQSAAAAALVRCRTLPAKLNSAIRPLMASVRREREVLLQAVSAAAVAEMMALLTQRKPSPNDKLVNNLRAMMCDDAAETPRAATAGERC